MRKRDSRWRDANLAQWHADNGIGYPANGIVLPFIEYDHGTPVGLVSYHDARQPLPVGRDAVVAHKALSGLYDDQAAHGEGALPFITVVYDVDSWTYDVLGHNESGAALVSGVGGSRGWHTMTEKQFATVLYRMRNRVLPDLSRYGVKWGEGPYGTAGGERFPGEVMSVRRRNFEPEIPVPRSRVVPCTDIDLMVPTLTGLGLAVDYKLTGARVDMKSASLSALSRLANGDGREVPALVVQYEQDLDDWRFQATPLNRAGVNLLAGVVGFDGIDGPVALSKGLWLAALRTAATL